MNKSKRKKVLAGVISAVAMAALVIGLLFSANTIASEEKTSLYIDGSTTVEPLAKAFGAYFHEQTGVNVTISGSGSGNGIQSIIAKRCDIAMSSRFMRVSEYKSAIENGVTPVAHIVALDGIAVIVNPRNAVAGLTMQQLKEIYLGKYTNWNQLGGADMPIVFANRESSSGTFECFNELVMTGDSIHRSAQQVASSNAMREVVASTPGGIGYIGLGYVNRTVKVLPINGVAATPATVASGRYPIARPLYFFTNGYPRLGSPEYTFLTLYLTKEGQKLVEEAKYIPLTRY